MNAKDLHQTAGPKTVFTVTELNRHIKAFLEKKFPFVWITGEISNLRTPSSGHLYFSLKDNHSQLSAVMFKGQARRLAATLEDGLSVLGMGRVSVYEPRGAYQVIIEYIEPKGLGDLQLAFEQLKQKLFSEGLFDEANKKKPPALPRKIHVITSPTGAVFFDTINIIQRRFANLPIVLIPTAVQGVHATKDIIHAIEILNRQPDAEIAILARGGGSLEDLQAFNDESVARAIYRSRIPIVSAIGHETDFTIADFVADLRAPTPSAAAELIVPDKNTLLEGIHGLEHRLATATSANLAHKRKLLGIYGNRLRDPRRRIYDGRLYLDDMTQRIVNGIERTIRDERRKMMSISGRILQNPLQGKVNLLKQEHKQLINNILYFMHNYTLTHNLKIDTLASRLASLNPMAVLERGYSITRKLPQRSVVKNSREVHLNDRVEITLASGTLTGRIEGKDNNGA